VRPLNENAAVQAPEPSRRGEPLRPHTPLPAYYRNEAEHQQFLRRIFDESASDYDRIERILAFGTGPRYRRLALQRAGLAKGAHALDVGIGTGLVAREALALIGPTGRLTGVDPSPAMLAEVKLAGVELVAGRAEALPQPDASHDFISLGYALRHIADVAAAFAEFRRVLRPGGRLLVLEISKPAGRIGTAVLRTYMRGIVPMIARVVAPTGRIARALALLLGHDRGLHRPRGGPSGVARRRLRER